MNNQKLFGRGVLLAVMAWLFAAGSVQAASYTNTASGNWTDSLKWNSSGIGLSGADTIIVFNPTAADNSTNNNAGAFSLNQLLVVPNYAVTLQSTGGSSLNFVNNGGTLPAITNAGTSTLTINSPITLATNLTVNAASSGAITINSNITETAMSDIIKLGANTLTLTGSNTFSGNLYIKAGTLANLAGVRAINGNGNWGPATSTIYLGDATVGANATLQDNGDGNGLSDSSSPINVVNGAGTRTISYGGNGAGLVNGPITLMNKDLTVGNNGIKQFILGSSVTGTGNLTIASTIANATWPFQLTGAINPVGAITNITTSICPSTISGAIGTNVTAVVQNSATSALTLSGNNTYSNTIVQAGTLTLSGSNTFSGNIYILAGLLTLRGSSPLGIGAYAGDITNAGTLVYNRTATQTLSGVISGSGTLTQSSGVLLINNVANTFNGATTVGAGATLGGAGTIAGTVSVASGALLAPSLGTGGSNTLTLSSADTSALTLNGGPSLKFALSSAGTNDQINVTGGLTLNGANFITLTCPGGALIPQGTYTLMTYASTNGSGTLAFNGTISNATLNVGSTSVTLSVGPGGTSGTLVSGLTWKGNLSGIWDTGTANWTNMAGSASTYADGNAVTFDQNASKFNVTGTVATVSPGSITFNNATAYTNGANIGGTGYLLKNGSSTATLTGTNTYTGPTLISAGTLTIGGAGQLGNGTYAGAITHNGAGLTFASSAPNTLSGGITGTGTVTKSGSGDLTIAGNNSIGALTLSAGTTVIANTTTLSTLATVGNVANSPATLILSNGTVTGITTLTVGNIANANTNGVRVTGGSLLEVNTSITMGNASSTGNYVTNFGGILQFTTAVPTITITNYPANALVITNGTVSFRGVNPVNLTNNWVNSGIGTNTVIWQGNNTLRLDGSTATNTLGRPYEFNTGFGPTNYVNLELLGTSFIKGAGVSNGVTIGAAGSMLVSNGTANITGALTNNGTVTLAGSPATLMATNGFYNNGLLTGSGTVSGIVTVGSAGILSPGGSNGIGTLTFSTNVVFNGGTNILTFTTSTNDQIRVLGTISGTNYLQIVPSPPNATIPANVVLFTYTGQTGPTYIRSITDGYAVQVTSSNVTLRASSRGYLMIIQ